jgi:SAM-dependent methyltransferase
MANFPPLKNYIIYCIDRLIDGYGLAPPFLDAGCGIGDISCHLALKGWHGQALDTCDAAIEKARKYLSAHKKVEVKNHDLFQAGGIFNTILLIDVLEHLKDDLAALRMAHSLLFENGHLIVSVPSNPIEWRWDDDFYGHLRRYDMEEIRKKLIDSGFNPLVFWDFTFPFFWAMRRVYTRLKSSHKDSPEEDASTRTRMSSLRNSWSLPLFGRVLARKSLFWNIIYWIQFKYFKQGVLRGHEMIILARKRA